MAKGKRSKNEKKGDDRKVFDFDVEQLKERLIEIDNFVIGLIDTIPPKIYFDLEVQEKLTADKHAIMDQTAETLKRSHPKHMGLSAKNKHKRARLDPKQNKSVSQIQEEMENEEAPKRKKVSFASAALTRATNVGELQKRLNEKLTEIKTKSGRGSETKLQTQKKLQRKMKKMKKKSKEKGNTNKIAKAEKKEPAIAPAVSPPKNLPQKPVFNKEGKIIYSKFDFGDADETSKQRKRKRTGKNKLKNLIAVAEKEKEKSDNLKSEDKEKSDALTEKKAWQRALQKAEGVKLKDDPAILKKTLKKIEKRKGKSNKAWKSRIEQVDKMKKDRQDKRTKNIKAKKQGKLDKKIKKAKKKGRLIPGF